MQVPVSGWVRYWASARPLAPAVVFRGEVRTWADLERSMDGAAQSLAASGVRPGDRVVVLMSNRPEFYEVFFAIASLGAVFVPANTRCTSPELAHLLEDSGAVSLITEPRFLPVLEGLDLESCDVIDVDGQIAGGLISVEPVALRAPSFDDTLAIMYTSGTTGRPKGAVLTHAAFHFAAVNVALAYTMTRHDRHLMVLPLCFAGGLMCVSSPIFLTGGTIVLEPAFDPDRTLQLLESERITVFPAAPTVLQILRQQADFGPAQFRDVRLIFTGAAPVPEAVLAEYQAMGVDVGQGYGLTESGTVGSFLLPDDALRKNGSVGRGCMFTEVRVVEESGARAVAGEAGEIQLRGPHVMSGYWRDDSATAAAFDGDWLRTGDVGILDDEGYLKVVDRLKDVVITGGMNVYPAEVEAAVYEHPAVAEVAVVGLPHEIYGETVTAVVVPRPGVALTLEDVRDHCAARLADYKVPRLLRLVEALPRGTSGKVLKSELRRSGVGTVAPS
jgi:fatty-acyl-CoA synthase